MISKLPAKKREALAALLGPDWTVVGFNVEDKDHVTVLFRSEDELKVVRFRTGYDAAKDRSVTQDFYEIQLIGGMG